MIDMCKSEGAIPFREVFIDVAGAFRHRTMIWKFKRRPFRPVQDPISNPSSNLNGICLVKCSSIYITMVF